MRTAFPLWLEGTTAFEFIGIRSDDRFSWISLEPLTVNMLQLRC